MLKFKSVAIKTNIIRNRTERIKEISSLQKVKLIEKADLYFDI